MSDDTSNTAPFKRCYKCGHKNRRGVIFCEVCGAQIGTGIKAGVTRASDKLIPTNNDMETEPTQPTTFTPNAVTQPHSFRNTPANETFKTAKLSHGHQPGTCVFRENMVLRLDASAGGEPIMLRPFEDHPLVLGRVDKEGEYQPDVDLRPFGGHQQGISRRHAAITRSGKRIFIEDLGSSNGTHINNVMIDAEEPHQLRDSDEIRLGNLVLRVSFQI